MPLLHVAANGDDQKMKMLSLMRPALPFEGCAPQVAAPGEQVLATARDPPPDPVVLDLMLPGAESARPAAACARGLVNS